MLSVTSQGATLFQFTRRTCLHAGSLDSNAVNDLFADTVLSEDGRTLRITPDKIQPSTSTGARKLDALPLVCRPGNPIVASTPTVAFEHLWHTFNDYYAFLEQRGINWDKLYAEISPTVTDDMSDDELLNSIRALLAPLDDGHVTLKTVDDEFEFNKERGAEKYLLETYANQKKYDNIDDYVTSLGDQWREVLSNYFDSEIRGSAGGSSGREVEWAVSSSNVGYLYIGSMYELTDNDSNSLRENVTTINSIMERALADLEDTEALIIDVRFNGGGYDAVSLSIANHFTDRPELAYSKYARTYAGGTEPVEVYFNPVFKSLYLKPVVVLASQTTASAAEVFMIIMSRLPHVTLAGEHTAGILADAPRKKLPNKWEIRVPNAVFVDSNGNEYEVTGVPPEIDAPTNFPDIFEQKRDVAIEIVLNSIAQL